MSTLALSEGPLIRRARLAESLVIAWMMVELVVALWAGIAARSVALHGLRRRQRHRGLHRRRGPTPAPAAHGPGHRGGARRARAAGIPSRRLGSLWPHRLHRHLVGGESDHADRAGELAPGDDARDRRPDRDGAALALETAAGRGASTAPPCAATQPARSSASTCRRRCSLGLAAQQPLQLVVG